MSEANKSTERMTVSEEERKREEERQMKEQREEERNPRELDLEVDVDPPNADRRMIVLGKTGAGKSSLCNTLIGRMAFTTSVGAESVTREYQLETAQRFKRMVQILDTPNVFDNDAACINIMLNECVKLSSPMLHALLLVVRVGVFTDEDKKIADQIKTWFGDDILKHTIIVFTGKDDLEEEGVSINEYLSESPVFLQELLDEVGHRYLTINNRASDEEKGHFVQRLFAVVDEMLQTNGGRWYNLDNNRFDQQLQQSTEDRNNELKKERDAIEMSFKGRLLSSLDKQLQGLQQEVELLQDNGHINNAAHSYSLVELNDKLRTARQELGQLDIDRQSWEDDLRNLRRSHGNESDAAFQLFKIQLDKTLFKKETETRQFSTRIESEREIINSREEEIRRHREEHNRRMEERVREEERMRRQKLEMIQREEELRRRRASEEESLQRRHRRRHRRGNECTVC